LAIAEHVTTLTTADLSVGGVEAPRALAGRLWPADRIAERHRRLAAEFTQAVEPDPLLPPELLPQPWVGTAARAAVAACWAELLKSNPAQPIRLFRWYSDVIAEITQAAPTTS
jgi:phenylacetic acid degradation operon negative regulatory protein